MELQKLKVLSIYMLAGILGGLVTFGMIRMTTDPVTIADENTANTFLTSTNSNRSFNAPFDFVAASEKANMAVVKIKAAQSETLAKQELDERSQDRGNQLKGHPFFEQFDLEQFFGDGGGGGFGFGFPQMPRRRMGAGSGVIVSEDGYIVTNNHVVGFADEIEVTLFDGRTFTGEKIGTDKNSDLALVKIDAQNLPILEVADSDDVQVGEWVLAVGNPLDLGSTVTAGIVSAKGRDIDIIESEMGAPIEEFIQTDAAVNPGNSGGALVDVSGNLVGINTAIATSSYIGYSFAIPSNLVMQVVNQIKENGGDIERAFLGVYAEEVALAKEDNPNIRADYGVYIDEVMDGSSAQFSGILPHDVITEVDGKRIDTMKDLQEIIKFVKVGDQVTVTVNRNGKVQDIKVKFKKSI